MIESAEWRSRAPGDAQRRPSSAEHSVFVLVLGLLLGLGLILQMSAACAQTAGSNAFASWAIQQVAGATQVVFSPASGGAPMTMTLGPSAIGSASGTAVSNSAAGAVASRSFAIPVATNGVQSTLTATASRTLTKQSIGKAVASARFNAISMGVVLAAPVVNSMLASACVDGLGGTWSVGTGCTYGTPSNPGSGTSTTYPGQKQWQCGYGSEPLPWTTSATAAGNCTIEAVMASAPSTILNGVMDSMTGDCTTVGSASCYVSWHSNNPYGGTNNRNNGPHAIRIACPGGGTVSGVNCVSAAACPSGQVHQDGTGACVALNGGPPAGTPLSDGDVANALAGAMTDPAGVAAVVSNAGLPIDGDGVVVSGPSTTQGPSSTSTAGNTVTTNNTVYNTNYNNNIMTVTNTTTTTSTVNGVQQTPQVTTGPVQTASASSAPSLTIPDDYNREVTQQAVLKELKGEGVTIPTDHESKVATAKTDAEVAQAQLDSDIRAGQAADKSMWFSWVWTPNFVACTPFVWSFKGFSGEWDWCPWVERFRTIFGLLLAFYACWHIYGEAFKGARQ